jgi:hypothetical protein
MTYTDKIIISHGINLLIEDEDRSLTITSTKYGGG